MEDRAAVAAAVALVGSYEMLMQLIRRGSAARGEVLDVEAAGQEVEPP